MHLIKLCVGCDNVEELLAWRRASAPTQEVWKLRTRQTPKRAAELTAGGSLYRVYKGFILSRQRILAVETLGEGPARRCEMTLDETVVLTAPTPRRAFQGWRYFRPQDAPADIAEGMAEAAIPFELSRRLREIGAW